MPFQALWLALAAGLVACTSATVGVETVHIESGLIHGVEEDGLHVFKGVPFAAPPVGDLRWRAPQPPTNWQGVLKADSFKPMCIQPSIDLFFAPKGPKSEDCLYLNIWTPAHSAGAKLPVMVWIHGGSFTIGSPSSPPTNWGDKLAKKGVVVVNLSYRLGNLGLLAHPELSAEDAHHVSGNYAILDMIAALAWIQHNISAFGGDPGSVTIFGHSAGGAAVSLLMISPLAKGLFHRAIGQSGAYLPPVASAGGEPPTLARGEQAGAKLTAGLGAASIKDLRQMPAEAVNAALNTLQAPIIDGYVVPAEMFEVFGGAKQNDVPLLVGSTDGEGDNFLPKPLSPADYVAATRAQYGDFADEILKLYPAGSEAEAASSQRRLLRDGETGWAMWKWARLQSAHGRGKVYEYYFAQRPAYPPGSPMFNWGAAHGSELFYVFGNYARFDWPWTEYDRQLSEVMTTYWTNFAKTGDPNGAGVPAWPAFEFKGERVLRIGAEIVPVDLPNRAEIELLDRRVTKAREQTAAQ